MTKARALLFILLLVPVFTLLAQEEPPYEEGPGSSPIESDWGDYNLSVYNKGDKTFTITLGLLIPTIFSGVEEQGHGIKLGGTGTLAFSYFLNSHFFVGGEVTGMFASTRGKNMLYMVPFGLRAGYQFVFRRFEFPISLMIGGVPTRYITQGYFGFILKPSASVFWRFNPDWSFGLNTVWWFVPQWPKNSSTSIGNFLEVTLSARYHF